MSERSRERLLRGLLLRAVLVLGALTLLFLAWRYTPLSGYTDPARLAAVAGDLERSPWGPLIAIGAFVAGGALVFPLTVMVLACALVFGAWWGAVYSLVGALLSGAIFFALGSALGRERVERLAGERLERVHRLVEHRGIVAVALLRLVPVAPYTVFNLVAGASPVSFRDFMLGTIVGMGPGVFVLSLFEARIEATFRQPTAASVIALVAIVVGIAGASLLLQKLVGPKIEDPEV